MSEFPPVFAITIYDLPYRRERTQAEFDREGVGVRWITGVSGSISGIRCSVPHDFKDDGTPLYQHPKVLAVGLTHYVALQVALASDAPEFFIMEDDVVLEKGFKDKWATVRESVPSPVRVIQCAVSRLDDKPYEEINDHLARSCWPFCAACNWWRREAAEYALKTMFPMNSPVDIIFIQRVFPFIGHAITKERIALDRSFLSKTEQWPRSHPGI